MVPDWVSFAGTGLSGAVGVFVGLKVGIARLEERYAALKEKVELNRQKLDSQVGESRCRDLRLDCQSHISQQLADIKHQISENRASVEDKFESVGNKFDTISKELKNIAVFITSLKGSIKDEP